MASCWRIPPSAGKWASLHDLTGEKVPLGENGTQRKLLIQEVDIQYFDGRGRGTEVGLKGEITNAALGNRDARELAKSLNLLAFNDAMSQSPCREMEVSDGGLALEVCILMHGTVL